MAPLSGDALDGDVMRASEQAATGLATADLLDDRAKRGRTVAVLTQERLLEHLVVDGEPMESNIGTMLRRSTYHYWFHNGEANAIRKLLGHQDVPELVGEIAKEAPYRPE